MSESLALLGAGLLAGVLGGTLGLGGGVVLMPLLRFGVQLPPAHAVGTCALAVFFTTLGGSYRYYRLGRIPFRASAPVIVAGAVAAVIGSSLFTRLAADDRWLDLAIGVVFAWIALRMLLEGAFKLPYRRRAETPDATLRGSLPAKVGIGAAAGILPGLLGIGAGGILVPAFTYLLRAPIKTAMAASLVCFCLNAFISSAFKLTGGFIDFELALPACLGTLFGANLGAALNGRLPSRVLKLGFGLVFGYVAWQFIGSLPTDGA
jgi:uncharacterized membrane protein YfcA